MKRDDFIDKGNTLKYFLLCILRKRNEKGRERGGKGRGERERERERNFVCACI